MVLTCSSCDQQFTRRRDLVLHRQREHFEPGQNFLCGHCDRVFTMAHNVVRHLRNIHSYGRYLKCVSCQIFFGDSDLLAAHTNNAHNVFQEQFNRPNTIGNAIITRDQQSIRGLFRTFRFKVGDEGNFDPFEYLVVNEADLVQFVNSRITNQSVKFSLCLQVNFLKPLNEESTSSYFNSTMSAISPYLTAEEYYSHVDQVLTQINIFCTAGSGWVISSLENLDLKICVYQPLRASSYIATPEKLKNFGNRC